MSPILSDEQLGKRTKDGDKEAAFELYERYVDRIYRYIAYRVPLENAEDLTVEVFVQMVHAMDDFADAATSFESWLYRIAAACVSDFYRLCVPKQKDEMDEAFHRPLSQPEANALDEWKMKSVREAVLKLGFEDQKLLILRFVERKSHKEVAEIMHENEATIRIAQYEALKRLAQLS